jgi:hypothetical protein
MDRMNGAATNTDDAKESVDACFEKRKPIWKEKGSAQKAAAEGSKGAGPSIRLSLLVTHHIFDRLYKEGDLATASL